MIIGIDVGNETHFARVFNWRGYEFSRKPLEFSNTEEGFETFQAWIDGLKEKYGMDKVMPGLEPKGHDWFNFGKFLQDHGMTPVHVPPITSRSQRNWMTTTHPRTTAKTRR